MAAPSTWQRFLAAIRAQESGGNYAEDTGGCLGAYCWNNQSSWDSMAAASGHGQYVGQNPATLPPQVQDAVASTELAKIYHATGSLLRAAEWWNGGVPNSVPNPQLPSQPWAHNCGGGTSQAYACQVLTRMQLGGHFLAGSGGPTSPAGSGSGGTVETSTTAQCLYGFGGIPGTSWINDIFGSGGNIGQFCILTRPTARAILAAFIIAGGTVLLVPGVFLMLAAVGTDLSGAPGNAGALQAQAVKYAKMIPAVE